MQVLYKVFLYKIFGFNQAHVVFFDDNLGSDVFFGVDTLAQVGKRTRLNRASYRKLLALLAGTSSKLAGPRGNLRGL